MATHLEAADHAPGAAVARHTHPYPLLAIVVSGALEVQARGGWHRTARGGLFTEAGEPHASLAGPHGARLVLLRPERSLALPATVEDPRLTRLARMLSEELHTTDAAAPLAREGLALQVLALATRAGAQRRPLPAGWMDRARDFLEAHLHAPVRLEEVAAVAGVHPAHFGRAFRQAYGEAPATYLRRRRVEWARERLLTSDAPLLEIALEAGFCDQGHFGRVFRRHFGCTPGQLRRRGG